MTRLPLLLTLVLALAACDTTEPRPASTEAVFVGNQGIFSDNGGSVTRYDPATGATSAVPGVDGLVQNVAVHNDRLYVLLNFSDSFDTGRGRIDVYDLRTGARERQIVVGTPRSMAIVGGTAFVSNFYGATVTPVALATGQAGPPIPVAHHPEGVVAVGQRVYVANWGQGFFEFLSVLDAASLSPRNPVDVCVGPRALAADNEGEVWVFCTGRFDFSTGAVAANGEVVVLNGSTAAVVARFPVEGTLGTSALGQDAAFSASRNEVFVAHAGGLLRFDTATNAPAGRLDMSGAEISAVAFDDATGRLVLGRMSATNPYAADGFVSFHDPSTGAETGRFEAGVIPSAVAFRQTFDARIAGR